MKIQVKEGGECFNPETDYLVVGILIQQRAQTEVSYHIVDDYGRLVLVNSVNSKVIIVDGTMEVDLVFKDLGNSAYNILPSAISYSGFFEQFFDNEPEARAVFFKRFPELKDVIKW